MLAPLGTQTWPGSFGGVNDTLFTGGLFIFVAYVLQPAITSAFRRVRAFHAWRAIEKSQTVEVTNYSMAAEIFRGRGKWDNARVVTVLPAVFSLASWGLELSITQASCAGNADLLYRPPPVIIGRNNGTDNWQVKSRTDLDGYGVHNVFDGYVLSRYYLIDGYHRDTFVNGGMISAYWSTEATVASNLFYSVNGTMTTVERPACTGDHHPERKDMFSGGNRWGTVVECKPGPSPTSNRTESMCALLSHGATKDSTSRSAGRTFVRKDSAGNIVVIVGDTENVRNNCAGVLGRGGTVVERICGTTTTMSAQSNKSSGGVAVAEAVDRADTAVVTPSGVGFVDAFAKLPEGPRTVCSEEARTGVAKALPGSNDVFCYPTSVL